VAPAGAGRSGFGGNNREDGSVNYVEAQIVLGQPKEETPLLLRLEAHAEMWRGATPRMMREHAWYIDEAISRIKQLEAAVLQMNDRWIDTDPREPLKDVITIHLSRNCSAVGVVTVQRPKEPS
jgi:hypothetical protein